MCICEISIRGIMLVNGYRKRKIIPGNQDIKSSRSILGASHPNNLEIVI